jgi:dTDP-3-amino-3,4,6-trideoxy-alpha-D-glucose transaminase
VSTRELPFIDLRPGDDDDDVRAAIDAVRTRGWFVLGPELEAFEAEFAAASGARFAVGVGNGTDAIALLLRASGIQPGDEVLVPGMTAAFTALAVVAAGARPVIVDVDPDTLLLDIASCERSLTPAVKAIVPVHLYGHPADMPALTRFAEKHGLQVIEDCCQAHLATCGGRAVGTFGAGGAFSFYPTKNLGALGDAGAVLTNDATIADRVRLLRNGGQRHTYDHEQAGVNSRLDEVQAAILRVRLARLPAHTAKRRTIGRFYREQLAAIVAIPPERDPGHVYHLFPIRIAQRDALRNHLKDAGIGTLVHYPRSLSSQPAFAPYRRDWCAVAERAAGDLLSLPLNPRLSDEDAARVVAAVTSFCQVSPKPGPPAACPRGGERTSELVAEPLGSIRGSAVYWQL